MKLRILIIGAVLAAAAVILGLIVWTGMLISQRRISNDMRIDGSSGDIPHSARRAIRR
jgi:hypothetical protein